MQAPLRDDDLVRRRPALLECDVRDELLVYAPHADAAVALNVSARAVWDLCRAESSAVDIAAALGERYRVPADLLLPDVRAVIESLHAHGLLVVAEP